MSAMANHDAIAGVHDAPSEWAAEQRLPTLLSDESPAAEFILAMLRKRPIQFVYWGGSSPGERRRVLVTDVFQIQVGGPVYGEGFCLARRAERVFRLDRVDLNYRKWLIEEHEAG